MLALLICMLVMGLADLGLYFTGNLTISQYYHRLFPQWLDLVIMVTSLVLLQVFFGWVTFGLVMLGVIMGHLFWHEGG